MRNVSKFIIFFFILIYFSSCQTQYIPVFPNTPLFNNKNEGQIEWNISGNGFHGKLAYSPLKHLGLQVNGQLYDYISQKPNSFHAYIEPVIGIYHEYSIFVMELYAGYGFGKTDFNSTLNPNDHTFTKYNNMFVQYNLGYKTKKLNIYALSVKLCDLNYSGIKYNTLETSLIISPKIYDCLYLTSYLNYTKPIGINKNEIGLSFINIGIGLKYYIGQ